MGGMNMRGLQKLSVLPGESWHKAGLKRRGRHQKILPLKYLSAPLGTLEIAI
jgi:hypothetical protein